MIDKKDTPIIENDPLFLEWINAIGEFRVQWEKDNPPPPEPVIIHDNAFKAYHQSLKQWEASWGPYIKEEGTKWWASRGMFVLWPEDPMERLQIFPLTEQGQPTDAN